MRRETRDLVCFYGGMMVVYTLHAFAPLSGRLNASAAVGIAIILVLIATWHLGKRSGRREDSTHE